MACCDTRHTALHGILNGVDEAVWDPWTDEHLVGHRYRRGHLRKRPRNKAALQERARPRGLHPDALLFGIISRLTHQKGMDLVLERPPHPVRTSAPNSP